MTDPLLPADRPRVQVVALLMALSIMLIGVLGFIPGVTTPFRTIEFAGDDSRALMLGAFQVSILLNLLHVLLGAVGMVLARTWEGALAYLIGGGATFVVFWLLGLLGGTDWIPTDAAGDWLHLVLGAAMLALAVVFASGSSKPPRNRP